MSTYAVFGMTPSAVTARARKKIGTHRPKTGASMDEREWLAEVEAEADKTMTGKDCVQLSGKFDAPQFAEEFLGLAQKSGGRRLHVKAYSPTGELSTRTGKPIMSWTDAPASP